MVTLGATDGDFERSVGCFILEHPTVPRGADLVESTLNRHSPGIVVRRVRGYPGTGCARQLFLNIRTSRERRRFLSAELACLVGHRKILRTFLRSGLPYALIFEDDAIPELGLLKALSATAAIIKKDFIVAPYESGIELPLLGSRREIADGVRLVRNIGGCRRSHAIFLDRIAAVKVYREMTFYAPADHFYGLQSMHGSRNFFLRGDFVRLQSIDSSILDVSRAETRRINGSILFASVSRKSTGVWWFCLYIILWLLAHLQYVLSPVLGKKVTKAFLPTPFGRQI